MVKNRDLFTLILLLFGAVSLYSSDPPVRERISFNDNWKFARFGPSPTEPDTRIPESGRLEALDFDDSQWRTLHLPHDWGIEGPFRNDLENNTGLLPWRGIGWYRKHFTVSETDEGKRFYIDFDGAMANARVWLNGQLIGEWPYGYTSFRFDLTPYIRFGTDNVIAVRLDTEKMDSRWYPGAGIYRNVWLEKTNPVHIYHWGVYITTPEITDSTARVDTRIDVRNMSQESKEVTVKTVILNPAGKVAGESYAASAVIPFAGSFRFRLETPVDEPERWDIEHPALYRAVTTVYHNDMKVDERTHTFGFRTLHFDTSGFYLNGREVEIKGVCNHHDLGPLGAAFNTRAAERQLEILKEMGCNAIRTSHNPPAPELLDLCDRMGFLIQVEAFDTWRNGKKKQDYNILFDTWHEEDLRAMIRRDWNHPSVFMWSIGNEVPDQWMNPGLAETLANIVRMEDPTRPVTSGCNAGVAGWNGYQKAMDVFGYNYNHWSYEQFFNEESNRTLPFHASETSSCLSSRGEYFFPVEQGNASEHLAGKGIYQVSSYDVLAPGWGNTPDFQFKLHEKYPRIMGEFVWTGFDYLGEPTPFNNDATNLLNIQDEKRRKQLKDWLDRLGTQEIPSRSSYFGIMDLCGFKKDRFYIYQSQWRPDLPMAHVLPHWNWLERIGEVTPVHVYTSGDEGELFINGKSQGRKKMGPLEYRLRWDDVIYEPGTVKVMVWKSGERWAEAVKQTTGEPAGIQLVADREQVSGDRDELIFVTVRIVDQDGRLVPRSHNLVTFDVEGPGEIVAVGNGNPASHEPFIASRRKAFNGLCLVILRPVEGQSGTINLTADSEGLTSDSIEIVVK